MNRPFPLVLSAYTAYYLALNGSPVNRGQKHLHWKASVQFVSLVTKPGHQSNGGESHHVLTVEFPSL